MAVSLRPDSVFGDGGPAMGRAQAGSAFTSLANCFFVSLVALIPDAGLGEVGENDYVFMTLGSITADSSYGGRTSVPELIRDRRDGGWAFWDSIARKAPDLPENVVFTVEYSVHGAMHAVYQLFGVDMEIPPSYHFLLDPKVGLKALESAFR